MRPLLLALTLLACGSGPSGPGTPPPPPPGTGLRIVMLGNSLTYYNDLPGMVAELADRGGADRPTVVTIAHANWALEDHWNNPASLAAIEDPAVDVVVMQQGPSTLPASGANLVDYATRIADLIVKNGTRPGMYVAWPPIGGNIDASIQYYTEAANARSMAIYPVAHAFKHVRATYPNIPIYDADEFHPTYAGSWLAAMIISATIHNQDPAGYPNLFPRFIEAAWEGPLRLAAKQAIDAYGRP